MKSIPLIFLISIEEKYLIKIYVNGYQSDCVEYKGFTFKRAETDAN